MKVLCVLVLLWCLAAAYPSTDIRARPRRGGPFPRTASVSKLKAAASSTYGSRLLPRSAPLVNADYSRDFLVPVTVGTQTLDLLLDTGSSQTWVFADGFECVSGWPCWHGPEFQVDGTFQTVASTTFYSNYADKTFVTGIAGYETLTVAGVTVPDQIIGAVSTGGWYGDELVSGLIGMNFDAHSVLFPATDPAADRTAANGIPYSTVMNTIFEVDQLTAPIFSLALSRDSSNTGFGGYLAIGGTPDPSDPEINASSSFTTIAFSTNSYYITIDGVTYGSGPTAPASDAISRNYVLDSGTAFVIVPSADAAAIAQLFDPPATSDYGLYRVDCAATSPDVQISIGGTAFTINPEDMVFRDERGGICASAFAPGNSTYVLGAPFLRNVLAVFDWGGGTVHLSPRPYYES